MLNRRYLFGPFFLTVPEAIVVPLHIIGVGHMKMISPKLPETMDAMRVLSTNQVCEITGYSPEGWRRLNREGKTPEPIRLSRTRYGWRVADIEAWIEARRIQRPKAA
jgi:predicted DNA-binding transcriptional regulator AlpA